MFYELKYINENGQSVKFEATTQQFVDTVETPSYGYSELKLVRFEGFGGVGADIQSSKSPNQDGSAMTNLTLEERYPYIEFIIRASDFGLLSDERRHLSRVFNPKAMGSFELSYDGRVYQLEVVPEGVVSFGDEDSVGRTQVASVNFVAHDPYWKDVTETRVDVSTLEGNWSFPWGIPETGYEMTIRTISFITNIYNAGSVEVPIRMSLTATGTVDNPVVTNLATGEYIRVKRTLTKGDELEIDTQFGNKRVEIIRSNGERENAFHYIDYKSTFFTIASGDTEIEYGADVGDNNLDVYIYYTPRYLGV